MVISKNEKNLIRKQMSNLDHKCGISILVNRKSTFMIKIIDIFPSKQVVS